MLVLVLEGTYLGFYAQVFLVPLTPTPLLGLSQTFNKVCFFFFSSSGHLCQVLKYLWSPPASLNTQSSS